MAVCTWLIGPQGLFSKLATPVNHLLCPALPKAWPELLALGKTVEARAGTAVTGFDYQWEHTGNWLFQSLVTSKGGRILKADGCSIAFDDANGMWALKTLEAFGKSGMPNLGLGQARQSFVAGNVAMLVDSTSYVAAAERQIGGRFPFKTVAFPLATADGRLPAGGNVAMVFAKDAERQKAAWNYVKFVTGPVGQTAMVNSTGYMPGGPARRFLCKESQPFDQYPATAVADGMGVLSR